MFRLLCAIAIIAFIFAHSRERPDGGFSEDASRWIAQTRGQVTEAALRSDAAQEFIRRSLAPEEKPVSKVSH